MYNRKHVKLWGGCKENIDMETLKIVRVNTWAIVEEHENKQEETLNGNICFFTDLGPFIIPFWPIVVGIYTTCKKIF